MKSRIFISTVSRELAKSRQLAATIMTRLGYEPEWQAIFGTEGGDCRQMLREKIDGCQGLVHIVGWGYGAEPASPDPEFGRVSYTQFELLYAQKQGKKTWVVFVEDGFPIDQPVEQLDLPPAGHPNPQAYQAERRALQDAWRDRLRGESHLWHVAANTLEFELKVERLKDELRGVGSAFRFWQRAVVAGLLLLLLLGGGLYALQIRERNDVRQVAQNTDQIKAQLDLLTKKDSTQIITPVPPQPVAGTDQAKKSVAEPVKVSPPPVEPKAATPKEQPPKPEVTTPKISTPPKAEPAFVPLFNGKDLTGWEQLGSETAIWKVVNKVLVGTYPDGVGGNSYLKSIKSDFRNFHLRLVTMKPEVWGCRINLFSPTTGPREGAARYRVSLGSPQNNVDDEFGRLTFMTKGEHAVQPLVNLVKVKEKEWITLDIICQQGKRITVEVNGVKTADVSDILKGPNLKTDIRLYHGAGLARFKSIEIKELP